MGGVNIWFGLHSMLSGKQNCSFQNEGFVGKSCFETCQIVLSSNYDSEAIKLLFLLPKVGLAKWAGKQWRSKSKEILTHYPNLDESLARIVLEGVQTTSLKTNTTDENQQNQQQHCAQLAKIVKHNIHNGHIRKAARVLVGEGLASLDQNGLKDLENLHPDAFHPGKPFTRQVPGFHSEQLLAHPLRDTIAKLPFDSAAGPSGWSFQMISDCWETSTQFQSVLDGLVKLLLGGNNILSSVKHWFTSSRLIALSKKGGGIRPIAVGESFTRVACRYALLSVKADMGVLLPQQYGVGTPGGVESVIWGITSSIFGDNVNDDVDDDENFQTIDFSNAFNTVSRFQIASVVRKETPHLYRFVKFLYNDKSPLLTRDSEGNPQTLWSKTGVRQGDPLGPFLFSLAIKDLVKHIRDEFAVDKCQVWAYLDDLFVKIHHNRQKELIEFLNSPQIVSTYGLEINMTKSVSITGHQMRTCGHNILGSHVGGTVDSATNTQAVESVNNSVAVLASRKGSTEPA